MTIQSILKKMEPTVRETLTALYKGLAMYGCGLAGIYYEGE